MSNASPLYKVLIATVRAMFRIPACYDDGMFIGNRDGEVLAVFFYMDSDITVHLYKGTATETHMGLDSRGAGHEFVTRDWKPDMPLCPHCHQNDQVSYREPRFDLSSYVCDRCNTSFLP